MGSSIRRVQSEQKSEPEHTRGLEETIDRGVHAIFERIERETGWPLDQEEPQRANFDREKITA